MEFELNKFAAMPNNWFQANIEYEGHGSAELLDPKGIVEGHVKIKFDEFGKKEIVMDVESVFSEHNPIKLLHQNTCRSLKVSTDEGKFYSTSDVYYDQHFGFHADKGSEIKLKFHMLRSIFQPNQTALAGSVTNWYENVPSSRTIFMLMGGPWAMGVFL